MLIIICWAFQLKAQIFTQQADTIHVAYNDYYNYSQLNGELSYSPKDSISSLQISAKTSTTYYTNSFKSNNDFHIRYLHKFNNYQAGARFYGFFNNDKLVSLPATGNAHLIPEIGYSTKDFKLAGGAGYVARRDQNKPSEGYKMFLDGTIGQADAVFPGSTLNFYAEKDNLDSSSNYNIAANGIYFQSWNDISLTTHGNTELQSYHQNSLNRQTNILRKSYKISTIIDYKISSETASQSVFQFEKRDKNSPNDPSVSENQSLSFSVSQQFSFANNLYYGSCRLDYKNNSDNFRYSDKEDIYSDYLYQFNTENTLFLGNYTVSLNGRYNKSSLEGKKLNDLVSVEDRDILQAAITHQISWRFGSLLKLYQSVPLDYYHLINISSARSAGNHTDRSISSVSGWQYNFLPGWQNKGNITIKTIYQVYDYSDSSSNGFYPEIKSFVIKENSISDSLDWQISDKIAFSSTFRYSYDEYGYLNRQKFTEQPINHSHGYLGVIGFSFSDKINRKISLDYIFHELDRYNYDKDDIKKSFLSAVYIQQGPRVSGLFEYRKIITEIQAAYYFYRFDRRELTFNLKAGYKFG